MIAPDASRCSPFGARSSSDHANGATPAAAASRAEYGLSRWARGRTVVATRTGRDAIPSVEQCRVDQPRHRLRAAGEQVQAVALEPLGMAARVDVPVDHAHLRMVLRRVRDVVVHGEVAMVSGPQGEPPHVLHARSLESGQRVLDVLRVLILEVVVAHRDHDVGPELRAHRVDERDDVRRRCAVGPGTAQPVDPAAGRDLEVERDPLADGLDGHAVARDRVGDRVPDQRDVLQNGRVRRGGRRRGCRKHARGGERRRDAEKPPHRDRS